MSNVRAMMSCLILLGCGASGDTSVEATDTSGTTAGDDHVAEDVAWVDMDRGQRLAFMQQTVTPEMQAMFQEFDAERFADFSCATCHGTNMQDVDFAMPNGVAPLDPAQIGAMFESEQPMAQFMSQRVWPRMTELLQAQPYNPETHEGFGCLGCHAMAE